MDQHDARQARFQDIFIAHQRAVVAYVARRTWPPGDWHTAEDVASAVFVTAWRRLDDIGPDPLPWLLVTARNILSEGRRGQRRRADREHQHANDRALSRPPTADVAQQVADVIVVRDALAQLSERDRELATLLAWDDLTLVQAAQVLGVTPEAARTRWKRLRTRLAATLADQSDPEPEPQTHSIVRARAPWPLETPQ